MTAAAPTNDPVPKYRLKSDLAAYCLPSANRDETRKLAWANSIALAFVIVAILGLRQPVFVIRDSVPPPEPLSAVILPPAETDTRPSDDDTAPEPEDIAEVDVEIVIPAPVPVAAPERVAFSVPVQGYVQLVSDPRRVPPPPPVIPQAPPPEALPRPEFRAIRFGGREFRKQPPPNYPEDFQRNRVGGTVEVLITVDTNGMPSKVEIGRSSGNDGLDRHVTQFIRREWRAEPGAGGHYRIAITFAP